MAIKSSNQITFVEHKKVLEIKEWYLATSLSTGVTRQTSGWTLNVQTISDSKPYLWNYEEVVYSIGGSDISDPVIIGHYGKGVDGTSQYFHVRYSDNGTSFTSNNGTTIGAWIGTCVTSSSTAPMTFNTYSWQKVKGEDGAAGKDGIDGKTTYFHVKYSNIASPSTSADMTETPSKYIGTYVDYTEQDSTDPSKYTWSKFMGDNGTNGTPGTNGIDGKTYYLHIKYSNDGGATFTGNSGENSGTYIGVYTDTTLADSTDVTKYTWSLIKGSDGKNGTTFYTWIKYADTPTSGMSDSPDGKAYIGLAYNKTSQTESNTYSDYAWSLIKGAAGAAGKDGATYYTWIKYADDASGKNMSDDPTDKEYIGIAYNKTTSTESTTASDYTWSLFKGSDGVNGTNGKDGKGISSIVNYYQVSTTTTVPSTSTTWPTTAPTLTTTNKYLWNYEVITYTDNTKTTTTPAIIGVYGNTGAAGVDAVLFEIYSTQGFLFKEDVTSIDLKIAAFKGSTAITGATYSWSYYNPETSAYVAISSATNVTTTSFVVNSTDVYATSNLKCVMTYSGKTYTCYAMLERGTVIYNADIRFLDGRNIFTSTEPYIVAYVNLYRNNALLDTIAADSYYVDTTMTISGTTITTTAPKVNDTKMYFIYQVGGVYNIVLGECKNSVWSTIDYISPYTYSNNLIKDTTSNIVLIQKDGISRSQELLFTVSDDGSMLTTSSATIIDLNDPIISPSWSGAKRDGQLWYDTSTSTLKVWDASKDDWAQSKQQGGAVYTTKPTSYSIGDLWIVENSNIISGVNEGTMLKAIASSNTFNSAHWIDAMADSTQFLNDARQYFKFDPNTGLRIGQANEKFYVNISSTKMGFHSVEYTTSGTVKKDSEVVQIGNDASVIRNATFEGNSGTTFENEATFNQQVKFGPFVWTVEADGGLSLTVDT